MTVSAGVSFSMLRNTRRVLKSTAVKFNTSINSIDIKVKRFFSPTTNCHTFLQPANHRDKMFEKVMQSIFVLF